MAQQDCRRGTQPGSVHPLFVRADDLCRQEFGADGDAHGALLDLAAIPFLEGERRRVRGVGREDPGLVCGPPRTVVGQRFVSRIAA